MDVQESQAAKRRVLVDALIMCLERSQVCQVVDAKTVKFVLDSASTDLWREGEFRLEPVWKILCQQPGLSAKEVAPPMLAFKAFEQSLGVRVRLPAALSAIPQNDQARLRDTLGITQEDFDKSVQEIQSLAVAEQRDQKETAKLETATAEAVSQSAANDEISSVPTSPSDPAVVLKKRRRLAFILTPIALLILPLGAYLAFKPPEAVDVAEFQPLLQLADAVHEGETMAARIDDPKWETLKAEDQKKLAAQVFDIASRKGFKLMRLRDGEQRVRVTGFAVDGTRSVRVH